MRRSGQPPPLTLGADEPAPVEVDEVLFSRVDDDYIGWRGANEGGYTSWRDLNELGEVEVLFDIASTKPKPKPEPEPN